ncbi:MAG: modA [Fibrobacteres bacterium]|nr:modA [Fibrobacterota bacterium]
MNPVFRPWFCIALALFTGARVSAQITIAAAANARFAMEALREDFRKRDGADVKAVYGSSGRLAAQIRSGAPFDVFLSADMGFPDSLYRWGLAPDKPAPYAFGTLVLWTRKGLDPGKGLAALTDPGVSTVALAEPKRAPYGRAALQALLRSGLHGTIQPKLVYGDDLSQVGQYLMTGNVDAAFTAKSMVVAQDAAGNGAWREVDTALYDRIAQGAVVCAYGNANHPALSARFLAYLHSAPARAILSAYGYALP